MIFLFIQASFSRYTLDFTTQNVSDGKYFKLFFQPFDVVEIKVNATYWTLFSSWRSAQKLYLTIITEKSNQTIMEFGPYKPDIKMIAVHFNEYNCTIKLSSDSADEQILSLMILSNLYDEYYRLKFPSFNLQEFPFVSKYNGTSKLSSEQSYPFYYEAESTSNNIMAGMFGAFSLLYIYIVAFSGREIMKKCKCLKPENQDDLTDHD